MERLLVGDRSIFAEVMAEFMECRPSKEKMKEFAEKYPDRFWYAAKLVGGLMGLSEKVEYEGTIVHAIVNLSDAELMKRLDEMKISLDHPMKNVTGPRTA